jgi:hypothetical protein
MEAATSKARPSAGGKASDISPVIKATERAGVCSCLTVKTRRPVESAAMVEAAVAEVTVTEIAGMEPVVTIVSAMRDEGVMVEECPTAMPVVAPMTPAPPKSSEVSDSKSNTERESDAAPKNTGHGIPARVGNDRCPVH